MRRLALWSALASLACFAGPSPALGSVMTPPVVVPDEHQIMASPKPGAGPAHRASGEAVDWSPTEQELMEMSGGNLSTSDATAPPQPSTAPLASAKPLVLGQPVKPSGKPPAAAEPPLPPGAKPPDVPTAPVLAPPPARL